MREVSEQTTEAAALTQGERLTAQFYDWEKRGRGWRVWASPVRLEPPFRPFFYHLAASAGPLADDARKPTLVGGLIEKLRARIVGNGPKPSWPLFPEEEEPDAEVMAEDLAVAELQLSIPPTLKVTRDAAEQFLLSLAHAPSPMSFEVVGDARGITVQLTCREAELAQVRQQLEGYFPEPVLGEKPGFLLDKWVSSGARETVVVDFGLNREFMMPIRAIKGFDVDPLTGIVSALSELRENEVGLLQVLFQPTVKPWTDSILRAVSDWDGGSFFIDAPQLLPLAREKVSRPLFAVVVRAAAQSRDSRRAWQIVQAIGGSLKQLASPVGNEFVPLDNEDYAADDHRDDVVRRRTHRSGMLLNSEELVSLVHVPSASVRVPGLAREVKKTKAIPQSATGHGLVLGENTHAGKTIQVTLDPAQRLRHTYVIGASGTGKSTLLLNLIVQDIEHNEGFAILDPHGDLVDQVLGRIPEERQKDVILLDPSDAEYPVGFNILSAHSDLEKTLLSSDLVGVFRRLSTSWGDQMTSVLGNAILAFLEREEGGTLFDLRRFLIEPEFRREVLRTVGDPEVVYYWQKEFPLLTGKPQAPLLTRLDTFLRPKLIRNMVAQKRDRLDFAAMMNDGKIVLAKLAQGAIGEENAYLLGTLLVSRFHQVALGRQEQEVEKRRPFYLYIDEFHNFVTPSMASILSGARKFGLGLVLAHQDLRQVWSRDPDVANAVISNPCTRICFRVGDQDAGKLEGGFSFFTAKDLQNLGVGEAVCRIDRSEYDFNLKTSPLSAVATDVVRHRREQIVAFSRASYATPREQVEAVLRRSVPEAIPPAAPHVGTTHGRERPPPAARPAPVERRAYEAPLPPTSVSMPPSPGRGGQEHKRLQYFIKECGESRGYRATIEKQILDGIASIDVALEKGDLRIACEVSVTSTGEQELGNVQKCLQAGFAHVLVISADPKALVRVKKAVSKGLAENDLPRVRFFAQEDILPFLDERDAHAAGSEGTVRGITVKRQYHAVGEAEGASRRRGVTQVLVGAFRRLKGKGPTTTEGRR